MYEIKIQDFQGLVLGEVVIETVEVSVEKEMTHITGMNNFGLSSASLINLPTFDSF